jgi:UDP-3-O-[3-hydroxymyristoyl] glucosamine N-acyltransferase
MFKLSLNSVLASEVAEFLGTELHGDEVVVYGPATIGNVTDNSLIHVNDVKSIDFRVVDAHKEVLMLCPEDIGDRTRGSYIVTPNPEAAFVRVIRHLFATTLAPFIHAHATIDNSALLGKGVSVFAGTYLGPEVEVGDGTVILQNVVVTGKVKIGANCLIKANTTIGSEVFDFVYYDNKWEQFPRFGKIIIGDDVWIGSNSSIEKGSIRDTTIGDGVKIDDLVQIGSGSSVGKDSLIAAGAIVCAGVEIGERCWIAPKVAIKEGLVVRRNSLIGLGAVVIRDVEENSVMVGNPARRIRSNKG